MKNYIVFFNDHSGSMQGGKARGALKDYNTNITAIKDAASREMLDTVVSVIGIGVGPGGVERQVMVSNPHVLREKIDWPTPGNTPLYDAIMDGIAMHESLPDYNSADVSFLAMVTTDGEEYGSRKFGKTDVARKIQALQASGRWTFVFRIPQGSRHQLNGLGVPSDNVYEWETNEAGMAASTVATTQAIGSYFTARSAGAKSSSSFYSNAQNVNTKALTDISNEVSLYVVPDNAQRLEIRDFILSKRSTYLKGAAFYQLVKSEARVGPKKMILIRERSTGKIFAGKEARTMLGLPNDPNSNARVHPGDHGSYDIFIQSESVNRLLPAGTGVVYWEKVGVPFTDADLAYLKPQTPPVPQLPAVAGRTKPTPSPVPKAPASVVQGPAINGRPVKFFDKRDEAREYARQHNLPKGSLGDVKELQPNFASKTGRWFVYL